MDEAIIKTGRIVFADEDEKKRGIMLLFDKPKDYSSARIVNIVKKFLNISKAGHSGTLDPKATGLMIICTGKQTKTLNGLIGFDKEYEGVMVVGEKTKSFDSETETYDRKETGHITPEMLKENIKSFLGKTEQLPPMYSAVKHKGKPLYKFARKGEVLERKPRAVEIKEFEITSVQLPEISFRVLCTKGTYIRTLVSDYGEKLGTGAYLKELRRTKIGNFSVKDAVSVEDFINSNSQTNGNSNIVK